MERRIHRFFAYFGYSIGGHKACIRNGCDSYCGYNATEALLFIWERYTNEAVAENNR